MGKEKNIENSIKRFLTQRRLRGDRIFFYKQFQNGATIKGLPDIVSIINGIFVGIEVKSQVGVLSDDQHVVAKNISSAQGYYVVADDLFDFLTWYSDFENKTLDSDTYFYNLTHRKENDL